jgi:NADH-quinone oxidoreductase subunit J
MSFLILNYCLDNLLLNNRDCLIFLVSNILLVNLVFSIFSINPVHSILFLIFGFLSAAILLAFYKLQFFVFSIILIYAGALSILLIFALVILDIKFLFTMHRLFFIVPFFIIFILFFFEALIFWNYGWSFVYYRTIIHINYFELFYRQPNLFVLGTQLYDKFYGQVLSVALILLVALLGSINLTFEKKYNVKRQNSIEQISQNIFNLNIYEKKEKEKMTRKWFS